MLLVGPIRHLFSQVKRKQILVLQNSKFRQISKSQDGIPKNVEAIFREVKQKEMIKKSNRYSKYCPFF